MKNIMCPKGRRTPGLWIYGVLLTLGTNSLVLVSVSGEQGNWIGRCPRPLPARIRLGVDRPVCDSCPWPLSVAPGQAIHYLKASGSASCKGDTPFTWSRVVVKIKQEKHRVWLPPGAHRTLVPCPSLLAESLEGIVSATLKQGLRTSDVKWLNNKVTDLGLRQRRGLQWNNAWIIPIALSQSAYLFIFLEGVLAELRLWGCGVWSWVHPAIILSI